MSRTAQLAILLPFAWLTLVSGGRAFGQALLSDTFEECAAGRLNCDHWSGDGSIEALNGDKVLTLLSIAGQATTVSREPESGFRVTAGQAYLFSIAAKTDSLEADMTVSIFVQSGQDRGAAVSMVGVRSTSSWHRMEIPFVPMSNGLLGVTVTLAAPDSACSAQHKACGLAHLDDIVVVESPSASGLQAFANACPEGYFANLGRSENDCEALHVTVGDIDNAVRDSLRDILHLDVDKVLAGGPRAPLGFDPAAFAAAFGPYGGSVTEVSDCSQAAVLAAVATVVDAGGGTVILPACTIALDQPIELIGALNVVLAGRGIGRTVLDHRRRRPASPTVDVENSRNVVIRDISLDLHGESQSQIRVWASSNVLVERVLIVDSGSAAVFSHHTDRMTVRYSAFVGGPKAFSDSGCQGHWFQSDQPSSADRNGDGRGSTSECELHWASSDFEPGSDWSGGYAAYSNVAVLNSFALHLAVGEVAGNRFYQSSGNKISDGHYWWVHDNAFVGDNPKFVHRATFWTTGDGIVDRRTRHVLVYRNRFVDIGNPPVRLRTPTTFVVENEFPGLVGQIDISGASTICRPSNEASLLDRGDFGKRKPNVVSSERGGICDLTTPGTIWTRASVSSDRR